MILLFAFSVTTTAWPSSVKEICAGSALELLNGRVGLAIAVKFPVSPRVKAEIFPLPPAFSTNTMLLYSVTLMGFVPPEDTVDAHCSPLPETLNDDTELLPAFTAINQPPLDKITAPWLPSPPPVPVPP